MIIPISPYIISIYHKDVRNNAAEFAYAFLFKNSIHDTISASSYFFGVCGERMKTTFQYSEVLETRRNRYKMSFRKLRKARKKRNEDELTEEEVRVFNEPLETEEDGNNFWTVWLTLLVLLGLFYNYTTITLYVQSTTSSVHKAEGDKGKALVV